MTFMKNTVSTRTSLFVALSLAMTLAACGGGGGGSTSTTSTTSTSPVPNGGTLASPQYASGSAQLAAFNQLNAMRQQCGFPALSENTLLDQAAANHMTYMQDNVYVGHNETQGSPGYTGATPQARATAAGYSGEAAEENAGHATDVGGALSIIGLASVPYHEAGLFIPSLTDFGAAYSTVVMGPTATYYVPEIMSGFQGTAGTYSGMPMTFPCQGTAGVDFESAANGENPTPTINGAVVSFPIGTPIALEGNMSDTIVLSSGQLTAPGGSVINLDLLDSATDSNHEMQPYESAAFPASPLQPNTTYSATITGTINGTPFSRNFSFTTGSQGQF